MSSPEAGEFARHCLVPTPLTEADLSSSPAVAASSRGHTKVAQPETSIYQDVSSALNQVGTAAYSECPADPSHARASRS